MANHFENIDRYFGGDMSAEEMQQLENIVSQDPLLEKEFSFQQELVEGIQAARKAELKAVLSNVDVTGATGVETGALTKILGGVAVVGILAMGAYFYFGEEVVTTTDNVATDEVTNQEISDDVAEAEIVEEASEMGDAVVVEQQTSSQGINTVSEKETTTSKETELEITAANVTEGFEDEDEVSETEAPINHLIAKSKVAHSTLEVSVEDSKKYSFHYQVKNNALSLYGNFSDLYELIEFHKDGNTTTYFKYDGKYYEIDKLQSKATPLVELAGDRLLNLLDNIENNKER